MVPSIYISGTTPRCLVRTEGNLNLLGTRKLVYCQEYDGIQFLSTKSSGPAVQKEVTSESHEMGKH